MTKPSPDGGAATTTEIMITAIAGMLDGLGHVAVGARSPIPGSAAHLARARSGGRMRVSILGSRTHSSFTDGARELFDCAGQGRIDAFFLSGGQIDGRPTSTSSALVTSPTTRARKRGFRAPSARPTSISWCRA